MFPGKAKNPKAVFPPERSQIITAVLIPVIAFGAVAAFLAVSRQGSFWALTSFEDDVLAEASLQGIAISKAVSVYYLFMTVLLTASLYFSHSCFGLIQKQENLISSKVKNVFSGRFSGFVTKHYYIICFVIMSVIPVVYFFHFRTGEYIAAASAVYLCAAVILFMRFGGLKLIPSCLSVTVIIAAVSMIFTAFDSLSGAGWAVRFTVITLILFGAVISKKAGNLPRPLTECGMILPWLLLLIRQLKIHEASPVFISIMAAVPLVYISFRLIFNNNNSEPSADLLAFSFISIVFAGALTGLFGKFTPNLYEGANHGYAVYDTLKNGRFPILENFDAHMLSNYLPGLIDALISGDVRYSNQGVGYELYLFLGLLLHYVFYKCFYDKEASLLLLFFAPLSLLNYKTVTINSSEHVMVMGLALILIFRRWWEKQSVKYDIFLWLSLAFSLVFSLEIGASFGVATLIAACIVSIKTKDKKRIASFFVCGACVALFCLSIVFILCHMHDLDIRNVISRFIYAAFSSNQNWAFGKYTNPRELAGIAFVYVLMPLAVIPFTVYSLFKNKGKRDVSKDITVIVILAFLLNLSRTIVRHTIFDRYTHFIWMLVLLLIISLREYKSAVRHLVPVTVMMLLSSFEFSVWGTTVLPSTSAAGSFMKLDSFMIEDTTENAFADLKNAINTLLNDDQTYIDFTNSTLLYEYVGKDKPVYVNQSPGLVSGRAAQKEFIYEIENYEKEAAAVLMPAVFNDVVSSMDRVLNVDRFFLISTYINRNYSPLCKVDGYAIWVKNSLYRSMLKKAEGIKHIKTVRGLSYMSEDFFRHSLQNIPYLWAAYGNTGKEVLSAVAGYDENRISEVCGQLSSFGGAVYCRINISADEEGSITLSFSNDETDRCTEYSFFLKPGTYDYAFCVSSDMQWSKALFNGMTAEADTDIKINGLYFTGDEISK